MNLSGAVTGSAVFTLSNPDSVIDLSGVTSLTRVTLAVASGATWTLPSGWNPIIGIGVTLSTTGTGSRFVSLAHLNASGVTLTINPANSTTDGSGFSNQSILSTLTGGMIDINGSFRVDNFGILTGGNGGSFNIAGNLLGNTRYADLYFPRATVRFDGAGSVSSPQLLEAMGQDLGSLVTGLSRNFVYSTIILANNTRVQLVDQSDNAVGTGAEAVYTDTVIVPAGTTLDLNGLHLYARKAQVTGTVVGGSITVIPDHGLLVTSVSGDPSGVAVRFSKPFDPVKLNLYATESGGDGPADVTLIGITSGAVTGSLVLDSDLMGFRFVKTGTPLMTDTYTLTLRSAGNGFVDMVAGLLDGNADGTPGGNYVGSFSIVTNGVLLSVIDIARGPGQPVNQPGSGGGLPLTLSHAVGANQVDFTLEFDPALLLVTGVTLGVGVPNGSTVTSNLSQPGRVVVTVNLGATLTSAAALELVRVQAVVPLTAATLYTQKTVLDLTNVSINHGALAVDADDGVFVNAYVGDATANRGYSTLDVQRLQRVVVRLDSGFSAYPLLDPVILGDTSGNGKFNSLDVQRLQQQVLGLSQTSIPPLPTPALPLQVFSGADPVLWIGTAVAEAGATVVVPIEVDQMAVIESVQLTVGYSSELLTLVAIRKVGVAADFQFGAEQRSPGTITIDVSRHGPVAGSGPARLFELEFKVSSEAPIGDVPIDLQWAALNDTWLTLNPAPKPGPDVTDGRIVVQTTTLTPTQLTAKSTLDWNALGSLLDSWVPMPQGTGNQQDLSFITSPSAEKEKFAGKLGERAAALVGILGYAASVNRSTSPNVSLPVATPPVSTLSLVAWHRHEILSEPMESYAFDWRLPLEEEVLRSRSRVQSLLPVRRPGDMIS